MRLLLLAYIQDDHSKDAQIGVLVQKIPQK